MKRILKVAGLTKVWVAEDGSECRLEMKTQEGDDGIVDLPFDSLSSLMMTLPAVASSALRRRFRDPGMRVAFPLDSWRVERASDGTKVMLTLSTTDGFEVTFSCSEDCLLKMAELITDYEVEAEPGGLWVH